MSGKWANGSASILQAAGKQPLATSTQPTPAAPPAVVTSSASNKHSSTFDAFIVLDFEATCENNVRLPKQEIIEFPMLVVDPVTLKVVSEFQRYVRPIFAPKLSKFCTELTGITQDVVDQAQPFPVVFSEALDWLQSGGYGDAPPQKSFCFVTCGDWDLKTMLPHQVSHFSSSDVPAVPSSFKRFINVKNIFTQYVPTQRRIRGMEDMLQVIRQPLAGRHHSGIDDCRNIATILIEVLKKDRNLLPTFDATGSSFKPWNCTDEKIKQIPFPTSTIVPPELCPPPTLFDPAVTKPRPAAPATAPDVEGANDTMAEALQRLLLTPPPSRRPNDQEKTTFSKKLSLVLRHRATELGLEMSNNGFVALEDLVKLPYFKHLDKFTLGCLVRDCPKQRFRLAIRPSDNSILIGANQGHSIEGISADLVRITAVEQCPVAVHGTYYKAWDLIQQSGGLSKMAREHVHFAKGLPSDKGVISGMRSSAQVLVYLNVAKCLADGVPLFESANGVILSPGVGSTGLVPLAYIDKVLDAKKGTPLL